MTTRTMTARTKSHLMAQLGEKEFFRTFRLIRCLETVIDGQTRTLMIFEVRI